MTPTRIVYFRANIYPGDGFVIVGTKPLSEPMSTYGIQTVAVTDSNELINNRIDRNEKTDHFIQLSITLVFNEVN